MLRMAEVRRNHSYSVIALAPSTPAAAEITAITNFRIISQTDFLIAIIQHLLSASFNFHVSIPHSALLTSNHPVTVPIRAEITMPADTDIVPKAFQKLMHK